MLIRVKSTLKKTVAVFFVTVIIVSGLFGIQVDAYDAYVYSRSGEFQKSLPLYIPESVIDLSVDPASKLSGAEDLAISPDGKMYIADTGNNRILVFDENYQFVRSISKFVNAKKEKDAFNAPCGIYVDSNLQLYIADTENSRIVVLDEKDQLVKVIGAPTGTGITDNFIYKPISVTVDVGGRVYAVSRSSNMGVLSFSSEGIFEGFLGVQSVTFSAIDLFWRTFMTQAQRESSVQNIPADYNDIEMDADGFLFVTSSALDKTKQYNALVSGSTASDYAPVKRLNPSGDDILQRNGFYPPAGDIEIDTALKIDDAVSAFSGVSVNATGMYSVFDVTNQRIFTYSREGNLLCVFGGQGTEKGHFISASALAYKERELVVLDKKGGTVTVFSPSPYGTLIEDALSLQKQRKYDLALQKWQQALPLNANLDIIYADMGKACLRNKDYDTAMEYFELVGKREDYSKAFAEKRNQYVGWLLVLVPAAVVILSLISSRFLRKVKIANKADDVNPPAKIGLKKQLQYAFYPIFHPFDGFYMIKRHNRGGVAGACVIMLAASVAYLISNYLSGYLFSVDMASNNSLIFDVVSFLYPFLLFGVANYCVTSLFNGEGNFRHIFLTIGYAMLPIALILPLATIIANLLSLEESIIVSGLVGIAYVWSVLLIFFGTISIHNYSFTKNIVATLITLLGMVIITFLLLLFASLTQKLWGFIYNVITELSYRL